MLQLVWVFAGATGALGGFGSTALKAVVAGAFANAINTTFQELDSNNYNPDCVDWDKVKRNSLLGAIGGKIGYTGGVVGRNISISRESKYFYLPPRTYGRTGSALGAVGGVILGNQ